MKLAALLNEAYDEAFRTAVRNIVLDQWKHDPFMPVADVDDPHQLEDDDFDELADFVDDCVKYAIQQGITDPEQAVEALNNAIRDPQVAALKRSLH